MILFDTWLLLNFWLATVFRTHRFWPGRKRTVYLGMLTLLLCCGARPFRPRSERSEPLRCRSSFSSSWSWSQVRPFPSINSLSWSHSPQIPCFWPWDCYFPAKGPQTWLWSRYTADWFLCIAGKFRCIPCFLWCWRWRWCHFSTLFRWPAAGRFLHGALFFLNFWTNFLFRGQRCSPSPTSFISVVLPGSRLDFFAWIAKP